MMAPSTPAALEWATPDADRLDDGTHVVLGTGQVGHAVARVLCDADVDVRVVNRSGDIPADVRGSVEAVRADVTDPAAARSACEGASVVYFCLQPPYDRWPELFPPLLDGALDAAEAAGATFVVADNLYAYGPVSGEIHEGLPAAATTAKGRTRAEMARTVLDAHEAGRVEATIGRASDFYGPGVTASFLGDRVFPQVLDGGTVWFPGNPDAPHTYTYIRDFARALVVLGNREAARGDVWHVPSAETRSTRELIELAADIAGTDPTVRGTPTWLIRGLGLVSSTLGEVAETQYQRSAPYVVSHETFDAAFEFAPTPHRPALERTLEWYRTDG